MRTHVLKIHKRLVTTELQQTLKKVHKISSSTLSNVIDPVTAIIKSRTMLIGKEKCPGKLKIFEDFVPSQEKSEVRNFERN